jgi:hypothetical protein
MSIWCVQSELVNAVPWEQAVEHALQKKRPKEGWTKPTKGRMKRSADSYAFASSEAITRQVKRELLHHMHGIRSRRKQSLYQGIHYISRHHNSCCPHNG